MCHQCESVGADEFAARLRLLQLGAGGQGEYDLFFAVGEGEHVRVGTAKFSETRGKLLDLCSGYRGLNGLGLGVGQFALLLDGPELLVEKLPTIPRAVNVDGGDPTGESREAPLRVLERNFLGQHTAFRVFAAFAPVRVGFVLVQILLNPAG